jgi:hypothetical protein
MFTGCVPRTSRDTEVKCDIQKCISSDNHLFSLVMMALRHETIITAYRNKGSQSTETCQHPSVDNKDNLRDYKGMSSKAVESTCAPVYLSYNLSCEKVDLIKVWTDEDEWHVRRKMCSRPIQQNAKCDCNAYITKGSEYVDCKGQILT